MRAYSILVPITPKSLTTLLEAEMRHTKSIGLQAPTGNTGTVFLGDQKVQPVELRPKANAHLPIATFNTTFVKGTSGDKLTVVLFDG